MNNLYILNEETIPELSEKTNFTKEQLWDMWHYDQSFGLVSKIYIIPAKEVNSGTVAPPGRSTSEDP